MKEKRQSHLHHSWQCGTRTRSLLFLLAIATSRHDFSWTHQWSTTYRQMPSRYRMFGPIYRRLCRAGQLQAILKCSYVSVSYNAFSVTVFLCCISKDLANDLQMLKFSLAIDMTIYRSSSRSEDFIYRYMTTYDHFCRRSRHIFASPLSAH